MIEEGPLNEMIADAITRFPEECCGFFFGNEDGTYRIVTGSLAVGNVSKYNKETSFEIASKDYLLAETFAEQKNRQLLGVYHSHPDHPSVPSVSDRQAAQPNLSYIIISVTDNKFADITSWQLKNHCHFEEEALVTKCL